MGYHSQGLPIGSLRGFYGVSNRYLIVMLLSACRFDNWVVKWTRWVVIKLLSNKLGIKLSLVEFRQVVKGCYQIVINRYPASAVYKTGRVDFEPWFYWAYRTELVLSFLNYKISLVEIWRLSNRASRGLAPRCLLVWLSGANVRFRSGGSMNTS